MARIFITAVLVKKILDSNQAMKLITFTKGDCKQHILCIHPLGKGMQCTRNSTHFCLEAKLCSNARSTSSDKMRFVKSNGCGKVDYLCQINTNSVDQISRVMLSLHVRNLVAPLPAACSMTHSLQYFASVSLHSHLERKLLG